MSNLIQEINCLTGEVIEREHTAEELEELQKVNASAQAELQAKEEAKEKREALLSRLGITEDEARLLLGGN